MDMTAIILSILGLCLFEVVSSIDNAVVNADVLSTMSVKWRKWFLIWGIFLAFSWSAGFCRGLSCGWPIHPLAPGGIDGKLQQRSPNPAGAGRIVTAAFARRRGFSHLFVLPLAVSGTQRIRLTCGAFFSRQGAWFFAIVSVILSVIIWEALKINPMMAFAASVGSSVFFITHGFKEHAARVELELKNRHHLSDISKIMYLEILDATFSIDGVIGAFAFTMSVPLIILGNGLGAIVVRQLTIKGVDKIKQYPYLKNGAMYSIFFLGMIMVMESFGAHVPHYAAPVITFIVIGFFCSSL